MTWTAFAVLAMFFSSNEIDRNFEFFPYQTIFSASVTSFFLEIFFLTTFLGAFFDILFQGIFFDELFLNKRGGESLRFLNLKNRAFYLTGFSWNQMSRNDLLLYFTCFGFMTSAGIGYNVMICMLKMKCWAKKLCPGLTHWVQN